MTYSLRELRMSAMERVLKIAEPLMPLEAGEDLGAHTLRVLNWWKNLPPDHELKQQFARETAERRAQAESR